MKKGSCFSNSLSCEFYWFVEIRYLMFMNQLYKSMDQLYVFMDQLYMSMDTGTSICPYVHPFVDKE